MKFYAVSMLDIKKGFFLFGPDFHPEIYWSHWEVIILRTWLVVLSFILDIFCSTQGHTLLSPWIYSVVSGVVFCCILGYDLLYPVSPFAVSWDIFCCIQNLPLLYPEIYSVVCRVALLYPETHFAVSWDIFCCIQLLFTVSGTHYVLYRVALCCIWDVQCNVLSRFALCCIWDVHCYVLFRFALEANFAVSGIYSIAVLCCISGCVLLYHMARSFTIIETLG